MRRIFRPYLYPVLLCGLNCIAIGGMRANQGIHAWNWVKIGDYYFIMDLTGSETQLDWMLCGMKEPDGSVNSVFDEYEEGPQFFHARSRGEVSPCGV